MICTNLIELLKTKKITCKADYDLFYWCSDDVETDEQMDYPIWDLRINLCDIMMAEIYQVDTDNASEDDYIMDIRFYAVMDDGFEELTGNDKVINLYIKCLEHKMDIYELSDFARFYRDTPNEILENETDFFSAKGEEYMVLTADEWDVAIKDVLHDVKIEHGLIHKDRAMEIAVSTLHCDGIFSEKETSGFDIVEIYCEDDVLQFITLAENKDELLHMFYGYILGY